MQRNKEIQTADEIWNRGEIKDCADLLSLARAALPKTMLDVHYRSQYRELIAYSNAAFYENRLNVPAQHPDETIIKNKPIQVVRVDGTYEAQTNESEAKKVVDILGWYWGREACPTIGVVTFNRKQADLIKQNLWARSEEDEEFRQAYNREIFRQEDGEDMNFFVKNVENVQGDERDVIIFSTTFGRNAQGIFRRFFGVLGQKGGERRLNVAISRAREKVVLVTSMPVAEVSDLLTSRSPASIPRDYLQGYLYYAECLSNGDLATARGILRQLAGNQLPSRRAGGAEIDGFPQTVAAHLREIGFKPEPVQDDTAFGVDFAIRDPRNGFYGIAIECDAPKHQILARARAREIWRPTLLAKSIRRVHRVSSHGWYHDRETEKRRLAEAVTAALS